MKWLLRLNKGFWYSILLFVLLTAVLAFSQPGLRFNIWLIEYLVPELRIASVQGNLLNGFTLHQLQFEQEQFSIEIEQLSLDNHIPCLFSLSLCVNQLQLDGVRIELATSEAEPGNETLDLNFPAIWNPLPVGIRDLQLHAVELHMPELHLRLEHFQSGFDFWGNRLVIQPTQLHGLAIVSETQEDPEADQAFHWAGLQLPTVQFPLQLDMVEFQLHQLSLNQELLLQHLQFGLLVDRRQLQLIDLTLQHDALELNAQLTVQPQHQYPLDASLRLYHHDIVQSATQATLAITGDLSSLQIQAAVDGALTAVASAELNLMQEHMPLSLQLRSEHLQWPLNAAAQYQLSNSRLDADGNLQQLTTQLTTMLTGQDIPDASLALTAELDKEQLRIERLTLGTLGGKIHGSGELNFASLLNWQSQWQFEQLDPGQHWPDYQGLLFGSSRIEGQLTAEQGWQLRIPDMQLSGWLRQFPLRLDGQLQLQDLDGSGAIELSALPLRVHHGQNRLELQGRLTEQWQMTAQLMIDDLADSLPDAEGQIHSHILLSGPRMAPVAELELTATDIRWQNEFQLGLAQLSGSIDAGEPIQSSLQLELAQASFDQFSLDSASLQLEGNELDHHLQLTLAGKPLSAQMHLSGRFDREQLSWSGFWQSARLDTELGSWQLQHAMALQLQPMEQQLLIGAHCWLRQDASLCLQEDSELTAERADISLALHAFELSWLEPWLPLYAELSGQLQAESHINWRADSPLQAEVQVSSAQGIAGYHLDHPIQLPWSNLQLQARLQQDLLELDWQLAVTEQGAMHGQLQLTELSGNDRQLMAELHIDQFSFEFLQPLLDEYSQLTAMLNSHIQIQGPLLQPEVTGHLTIGDLSVRGQLSPIDVERGEVAIQFKNDSAVLQGFIQTPQGQLRMQGDSQWADLAAWQATLKVQGDPLSVQMPLGRMRLQPDLQLTATPERALLTGAIDIPWARLVIDSLPDAAVSVSRDEVMVNEHFEPLTDSSDSRPFPIHSDIRIRFGDEVRFAAFGLRSHIRGNLQVRQESNQPRLYGELNLVDGTFRSYGQDLQIRRGQILFNGPADQPFLNLEAIRNPDNIEDDVIAGIRVNGPADEPNLQIFSEPAMAQANATSYLLLGRNLDSESGSGANPVTTSLIGLGLASSSKLVGSIGEAFGVQDLALDTAGSGDQSQVTVSGYLTRNLQVKYGVGIFEPFGEFTLRYRLMRNLYLESVTGLEQSVDLLYRFEFN